MAPTALSLKTCSQVRAAVVSPRICRSRPLAVKVVAYRDSHREHKVCSLGTEVVNSWFKGIAMGPAAALDNLRQDTDESVEYCSKHVLHCHKGKGQDYLLARLTDQSKAMELVNHRILASAACSHDDTYFALVEYKYKPKHTPDAFTNVGYKIMELDTMYDDTCLKVTSLSERSSFSPEDLAVMGQSDAGIKAMSSTTPFPEHEVTDYPTGLENEVVVNNLKTWCKARSSGESEVILDSALDHSFKLWDAYGMLPMLCDPARRAEPDACVVGFTDLKDMIKQTKHRYLVTCKMIDNGVSLDKNVAFTHWCSSITNKQSKQHFNIEGLEVDIFGSDGKLKNIWQFRDPMDFELDMLEGRMPAGDSYKAHAA
eukprot:GHRR01000435.1.p1 GENE.GHRR01000435.1~~GHRR01000435.1.p1  ORF type:complete len:370 (+),score=100.51 GHRR01000435.1:174-1283(+)